MNQKKVFSLPNAIPLPELISREILIGPPRFLQIGALNKRKNPFLTLKAFENVQKLLPTSTLTFVGDGPLYAELENYIKERHVKNVSLVGEVSDASLFYMKNNVLILPSKAEGLPYTLIEGAGYGMPLICSNVDGIPEICISGYNGILLKDFDKKSMQKAMIDLSTNKNLRLKYGNNGRELVTNKFETRVFVNKLLQIYKVITNKDKQGAKEAQQQLNAQDT